MKRREEEKKKIRDAAVKLFYEKGYTGATMRSIAAECGMPLATMQYYYGKKEQIFTDIMTPMVLNTAKLLKKLSNPRLSNGKVRKDYIEELAHDMEEHIEMYRYGLIIVLCEGRGSPYENRREELLSQIEKIIMQILHVFNGDNIEIDNDKKIYAKIVAEMVMSLMVTVARYYESRPWVHNILLEGISKSYDSLNRLAYS